MQIQEEDGISYRDDYKGERLNYARADLFIYFFFFFAGGADIEWRNIMYRKTIKGKYEIFLQKYNEGVKKYVLPFYRIKKKYMLGTMLDAQKLKRQKIKLGRNS
ncbi:hypothetical protein E2C01_003768 [Portunus trituberculatus]|uniref:Uncharacterized protein n=1 Tax=Portunus trituberculatus TaxID=210409 RepID=A0A5B7CR27_PORTR|nr:hypothetical protein [Portunus trituberculatus]